MMLRRSAAGGFAHAAAAAAVLLLLSAACASTADSGGPDATPHDDGRTDTGGDTGACPDACPPGESCIHGRCTSGSCTTTDDCPAGQTCCSRLCSDTHSDPTNCGGCGTVCAPGGDNCLSGTCSCNGAAACASGLSCCPGLGCIDTTSSDHCGDCTTACGPGVECLAGSCGGSCVDGCPDVPHGQTACAGEACALASCDDGWADVDGLMADGCECEVTAEPTGGDSCDTAIDLGSIAEHGTALHATGNILPVDDEDWYTFTALDTPETDCDAFYVDVRFASNPSDQFAFSVYAGDCSTNVCAGDVLFTYYTDFNDSTGPEIHGECPCTTVNTPGLNMCEDSSKTFFIRVRRVTPTGTATCDGYDIAITNATYSSAHPGP